MATESIFLTHDGFSKWEEEGIMGKAIDESQKSRDPDTKVGAVLVSPDGTILGCGYNSHPKVKQGLNSNDVFPWTKDKNDYTKNKHNYVCHAELNAIVNAQSEGQLKGSSLYVTLHPCFECAKLIVQYEIKEVIFISKRNSKKILISAAMKTFCHSDLDGHVKSYKEHMKKKYSGEYQPSEKLMNLFTYVDYSYEDDYMSY